MSINTITSTFNNHFLSEEINRRRSASDAKNQTDALTFSSSKNGDKFISHKVFDEQIEKKRLNDEIKEVWDE